MTVESDDPQQDQAQTQHQDAPSRPDTVPRSVAWPDNASMSAQQRAALQQFRQNSERLQQQVKGQDTPEPSPTPEVAREEPGRGNYNALKVEQAKAVAERNEPSEDELTFTRDRGRQSPDRPPRDDELTFIRDRSGPDLSRGR